MFEAVNSVISNAPFVRASAEQISSARSNVSEPPAAPQAPYLSPFISLDLNYDKAVIQIRDSNTGDVLNQFPSEEALELRAAREQRQVEAQQQSQVSKASAQSLQQTAYTPAAPVSSRESTESVPQTPTAPPIVASSTSGSVPPVQTQIAAAALTTASQSGVSQTTFATEA